MSRSFRALSHRNYLFVWLGSLLSNVGTWMENVGAGWVVANLTHDPFKVELLSFAQFLPVLFLALPGGVLADKYNRKKVLLYAQISLCVVAAMLTILAFQGLASPNVVIIFAFLSGCAWSINAPAWQSVVPHLIPRRDLESAIALNSVQYNLARLLGPAIAGWVVFHWGVPFAFVFNTLSFLAVIFALAMVKFELHRAPPAERQNASDVRIAFKWVWEHRGARRIILSISAFAILSAPLQGLMPFFASDLLHIGPKGLGNLLACLGAGAVTGAYLLGHLPAYYPRHHLIPLSISTLGIFGIFYSQSQLVGISYVTLFIAGIFWLWTMVSCNTAMQLLVPDHIRGRAMSILLIANIGMLPLGHILGGILANMIGPRQTLLWTSICLITVGILTIWRRVPEIDGFVTKQKKIRINNFVSEVIFATSHRAEALSLDRSSENR